MHRTSETYDGQQKVRHLILDTDLYVGESFVGDASAPVRFSTFQYALHGIGESDFLLLDIEVREQLIFPEIDYDKIDKVRGMDICFVTTAATDEESRELLTLMALRS